MDGMSSPIDQMLAGAPSALAKSESTKKEAAKEAVTSYEGIEKGIGDLTKDYEARKKAVGEAPKYNAEQFSPPKQENPVSEFGSFASAMAIIASGLTRAPLTTALNAAAAGMNAVKQTNLQNYEEAYKTWKANTDVAHQQAEWEIGRYHDALDAIKTDYADGMSKFKTMALLTDNKAAQMAAEGGDPKQIIDYLQGYQRLLDGSRARAEDIEDRSAITKATLEVKDAQKQLAENKDPAKAAELAQNYQRSVDSFDITVRGISKTPFARNTGLSVQGQPMSADERKATAAAAATGMPISALASGYGKDASEKRSLIKADALKMIMEQNGMTAEQAGAEYANRQIDYLAGKKSVAQLDTMLGATRTAVDQLDFNISKAKEEMNKLASSDISPIINAIARGEEKWSGDPAYSGLFYFMSGLAAESARIQSGGVASAAQLHEGAQQEAQKWANINMTPASFDEVARDMKAEGKNRLENYENAIKKQRPGQAGSNRKWASGNGKRIYTDDSGKTWHNENGTPYQ